jgi:hypothetical protein
MGLESFTSGEPIASDEPIVGAIGGAWREFAKVILNLRMRAGR